MLKPSFLCLKLIIFIDFNNIKCLIFSLWICLNNLIIGLLAVYPSQVYSLIKWRVIFPFLLIFISKIFLLLFYQRLLLRNNASISILYLKVCIVLLVWLIAMILNWKGVWWKCILVFRLANLSLSYFLYFYIFLILVLILTKGYSSIILFVYLILVLLYFIFKIFVIRIFILEALISRVMIHVHIRIFCQFGNRIILNLLAGVFIKGLPSW